MRIEKQDVSLDIENDEFEEEHYRKHGMLFPSTVRCILVAPSNCGKTNVMIN